MFRDLVGFCVFKPKKRIENAHTQSGRIVNPPERKNAKLKFLIYWLSLPTISYLEHFSLYKVCIVRLSFAKPKNSRGFLHANLGG